MGRQAKINLTKCGVVFDEATHTYTLDGKQLSGVTTLLHRTIFADMYSGVSQEILDRAASRGTDIHNEVSMYISAGLMPDTQEGLNFVNRLSKDINPIASEYLVTDGEHYASSIDIVGRGSKPKSVILYDIKTPKSGIKKDYTSWQLSIYAYLFEKQNPTLTVESVNGVWLSEDNAEIVSLDRKDSEMVENLMTQDINGVFVGDPSIQKSEDIEAVAKYVEFENQYIKLNEQLKNLDELKKTALDEVSKAMATMGITSLKTDKIEFTMVADTTKTTFDSKKFKVEYPDLYDTFSKVSPVKGYLKARIIA